MFLDGSRPIEAAGRPRDGQFNTVLEPVESRPAALDASIDRVSKASMTQTRRQRTTSCPPAGRSGLSGPWSLEWLEARKGQAPSGGGVVGDPLKKVVRGQHKTKSGGFLQNSLPSLKRIARLPINDRREVLQILQKSARKRRLRGAVTRSRATGSRASAGDENSSSSVNNDWQHWVAMQGHGHTVEDDVVEVGNFVGATCKGDTTNMFSVLSKPGTDKRDSRGAVKGEPAPQEQPR
jgi:hypothetical protein